MIGNKLGLSGASYDPAHETIIFMIRLPRVFLGVLVGIGLSVVGATVQGLFRNPMADPWILGVSSGAALGAAISILVFPLMLGIYTTPALAFLGAIAAFFLVYNIAKTGGRIPTNTLLLSGIAVAFFLSACLSLLMWLSGEKLHQIFFWLMGGLWVANWMEVQIAAPIIFLGVAGVFLFARDLNAMLLGEEEAKSLGVNVEWVKNILLLFSALLTAIAVCFVGGIGFIALIVPHITRVLVGPDHRILIPASALVGGILLVWADTIARYLLELPVGVVTAFAGAPFFIYLLKSRRRLPSL